ncbi:hypothetical protein [Bradyrhizobium sp. 76]|uniref:hypothetical protein n=1 Tax=Bradyrhizobium sp. 76 TaxID=2782680 RepID=UPI001FF9F1A7|nr:hypothetical protein [Bradyrhizobium sp. 76]MCK1410732.1 hypothetical protein [Bradyrhizobium sp. 76]
MTYVLVVISWLGVANGAVISTQEFSSAEQLRSSPDGADGIRESAQQRQDTEAALHTEVKKRRKG